MFWALLGMLLVSGLVFILFVRLYMSFTFHYIEKEQSLIILLRILHIKLYEKQVSFSNDEDELLNYLMQENGLDDKGNKFRFSSILQTIPNYGKLMMDCLQKVTIHELSWKTNIGTGEAALTGLVAGAFWSIKGSVLAFLTACCRVKQNAQVEVVPHFQQKRFQIKLHCIVSIRLGQAIYIALKINKALKSNATIMQSPEFI
ncbi:MULTISPECIES: DUF2953 domain-containing protein [unclassified Virgibacillus]|uniref:DUF2953 domain-containing protein n=1 Tax=unclassified Virgibacillus TaxID=2620237 RepID=UPI0024DE1709|nr:DUF2953 domain-containing protein [Virgibacillus sp. LDC-1]